MMCNPNLSEDYLEQVMSPAMLCLISLLILVRDIDISFDQLACFLTVNVYINTVKP